MRYVYYYIWIGLSIPHPWFAKLFMPVSWVLLKAGIKSDKDFNNWKKNYSESILGFPGGINDWFAYGILVLLFLIPIIVVTVKCRIDIYTNKYYFGSIAVAKGAFCYYWIYFRNIDWLKERINKVSKKYYLK